MKRRLEIIAAAIILIIAISTISAAVHVYRQDLEIKKLEQIKSNTTKDLDKTQDQ